MKGRVTRNITDRGRDEPGAGAPPPLLLVPLPRQAPQKTFVGGKLAFLWHTTSLCSWSQSPQTLSSSRTSRPPRVYFLRGSLFPHALTHPQANPRRIRIPLTLRCACAASTPSYPSADGDPARLLPQFARTARLRQDGMPRLVVNTPSNACTRSVPCVCANPPSTSARKSAQRTRCAPARSNIGDAAPGVSKRPSASASASIDTDTGIEPLQRAPTLQFKRACGRWSAMGLEHGYAERAMGGTQLSSFLSLFFFFSHLLGCADSASRLAPHGAAASRRDAGAAPEPHLCAGDTPPRMHGATASRRDARQHQVQADSQTQAAPAHNALGRWDAAHSTARAGRRQRGHLAAWLASSDALCSLCSLLTARESALPRTQHSSPHRCASPAPRSQYPRSSCPCALASRVAATLAMHARDFYLRI
ncbi:hypothetical protein C8R47DRAFT_1063762 [Mycena vitilis]|nr:hypothetical protein C8R47DRAFT_1063762 [Mycena vitilis]